MEMKLTNETNNEHPPDCLRCAHLEEDLRGYRAERKELERITERLTAMINRMEIERMNCEGVTPATDIICATCDHWFTQHVEADGHIKGHCNMLLGYSTGACKPCGCRKFVPKPPANQQEEK